MSKKSMGKKRKQYSDEQIDDLAEELRTMVVANHQPLPDEPEFYTAQDTLLRFLKARKYVVKDAYKQLAEAIEWRRQFRPTMIDCHWCAEQAGFHGIRQVGFDAEQRPVLYACFAQCQTLKNTAEDTISHVTYLVENALKCTEAKREKWVIIIDCTGLTLPCCNPKLGKQFSQTFGTNYPEHLSAFYLINHNPVLEGVWNAIKVFLDPVTASKVKLVKKKKIEATFNEDFGPELSRWLIEEIQLNRKDISEAQRRFWEKPQQPGAHDPRGTPSYVTKYIEPLELRRKTIPNERLARSTLGLRTHLLHPNIMHRLNGQLENVVLIDLKNKKSKPTKNELEQYGISEFDAMTESNSDSD